LYNFFYCAKTLRTKEVFLINKYIVTDTNQIKLPFKGDEYVLSDVYNLDEILLKRKEYERKYYKNTSQQ